jgi:uncharacterized protein with PQ loop repeat
MNINIPEYGILLIGYTSAALSMVYRIPQIYQLWKTKRGVDISLSMIIIQQLSYILAVFYGLLRLEYVYITTSSISFLQNLVILYIRRRNLYNTLQYEQSV